MKLKVKGKEYILKFGYRVLAKTSLLSDVVNIQGMFKDATEDDIATSLPKLIEINSNLVLAGLQKYNVDFKVDYDDPDSVKANLEKVYDFMDDYMDEEDSLPVMDLFGMMVQELTENGFLSKKSPRMEQAAEAQDATVIPADHRQEGN